MFAGLSVCALRRGLFLSLVSFSGLTASAATYYWNTTTTALWSGGANWSDNSASGGTTGVVPGATDSVVFDQSSINGAEIVQLDAATSIAGITFVNTGTTTINNSTGSNTLTIGLGGITENTGSGGVTIAVNVALGAAQTWTNNSTAALAINGTLTQTTGNTLNFAGSGAGGFTTTSLTNTNGILGTWATFGTGTSMKYATVSGASIIGLTGTAAATAAALTDTTGTVNYDLAASTGTPVTGFSGNTIRYTGAAGTLTGATSFTVNGLMNVGTGLLTINTTPVTIGANKELVVTGPTGITISTAVVNNAGGASALTMSGTGTLTLSGVNTYTGLTTVNSGTLFIGGSTHASSAVAVKNGGTLSGTGSALGAVTVATGGKIAPGNGGALGTLTAASLVFQNTSTSSGQFNLTLGTPGTPAVPATTTKLAVTGALTLPNSGQAVTVNLTNSNNNGAAFGAVSQGWLGIGNYQIATFGSLANTFNPSQLTIGTTPLTGKTYTFSQSGNTINLAIAGPVGVYSNALIGTGDQDANVGLSASKTYFNAVNLNGGALPINGVNFAASSGTAPSTATFNITGTNQSVVGGGTTGLVTGNLGSLINDFIYNGSPTKIQLTGLTLGQTYVYTLYNRIWDTTTQRMQNWSTTDGAVFQGDLNTGAATGNLTLQRYTFIATDVNETMTLTPSTSTFTQHLYGFSTEQVFNKNWSSGATWSAAAWSTAGTPNSIGANANFTAQGSPTSIDVDAPMTVGHLQFEGANAWTVTGASDLTIHTDIGGVSVLNALSGTHAIAAPVTLSNNAVKYGTGNLTFTNAIAGTAGTQITIADGTLQLGDGTTAGSFNRNIVDNAAFVVNNPTAVTLPGVISGIGTFTKTGAGTLTLTGTNTLTGTTTISAGALQLGDGTTTGVFGTGTVTDNASLIFNPAAAGVTIANVISGTGSVTQSGANRTILTGSNSYTGGTNFAGGILQAGSANALGTTGNLVFAGGTLQYATGITTDYSTRIKNSTTAAVSIDTNGGLVTYASAIDNTNTQGLTKSGTNTLTLNGVNTYTGPTTINAGTLSVGGSLSAASNVTINTAGALSGAGAINGNVIINSGGTSVSSGTIVGTVVVNSGGTLASTATIGGATTLAAGAILSPGSGTALGTLNASSVTLQNTVSSSVIWNLNLGTAGTPTTPGNGGRLAVSGALTIPNSGQAVTVNLTSSNNNGAVATPTIAQGWMGIGTYQIATFGSLTNPFNASQLAIGTTPFTGKTYTFSQNSAGTGINLTISGPVGVYSNATLGTGTFDTAVGLDVNKTYLNAVNTGSASPVTVNGVTFTGNGAVSPSGSSYAISGYNTANNPGGTNSVGGSLGTLVADFLYGNNASTVTLSGLTAGKTYVYTTYNRAWEAGTARTQNVSTSDGGYYQSNLNGTATAQGQFTIERHTFYATATSQVFSFTDISPGAANHLAAISTEDVFNKSWTTGANWSTATWTGGAGLTPNYVGANANFTAQGSPTSISADAAITVGHMQFDGTNAWTVTGPNTLTVQTDVGGVSVLNALTGTHTVAAAIALNNSAIKYGTGTLMLTNTVTGSTGANLTVADGTLQFGDGTTANGSFNNNITNNAALVFSNPFTQTYSGAMSGMGGLTKSGAGLLTLTGTSTYSGPTTISAGTLRLGDGTTTGSIGPGAITNTGNLTLQPGSATNLILPNPISGLGSVTKEGGNRAILLGANTYSGGTTVNGGTLALATNGSAGSGTLAINSGATVKLGNTSQTVAGLSGSGNANWGAVVGSITSFSSNLDSGISASKTYTHKLDLNGQGAAAVVNGVTFTNAGVSGNDGNGHTWSLTGAGTGFINNTSGSPWVSDGGTTTGINKLFTDFIYGGNPGTLTLGGFTPSSSYDVRLYYTAFGTPGTRIMSSATLTAGDGSDSQPAFDENGLAGANYQAFSFVAGTDGQATIQMTPLVAGNSYHWYGATAELVSASGPVLTVGDTNNYQYDGVLSGPGSVVKQGTGTQIFNGVNTYTGTTTINNGTFQLGDGATKTGSVAGNIVNNSTAAGSLTFANPTALTYGGIISGAGGLTKTAAGTLSLTRTHTYAGPTTISGGSVQLGLPGQVVRLQLDGNGNDSSGNGLNSTLVNGPTFVAGHFDNAVNFNGTSQYASIPYNASLGLNAYTVNLWANLNAPFGSQTTANPTFIATRLGGENTFDLQLSATGLHADIGNGTGWLSTAANATTTLTPGQWNMITYAVNNTGYRIYVNGAQVATGSYSGTPLFMKPGQTLTVGAQGNGSNTIGFYLNAIMDEVNVFNSALSAADISNLYLEQAGHLPAGTALSVASGSSFNVNGYQQAIASLAGAGDVQIGTGALTVGDSNNTTFSGVVSGSGSFTKTGSSVLTLTNANTFSGTTTISQGTLRLGDGTSNIGSIAGPVVTNATLEFANPTAQTHSGAISGTGAVVKSGAGALTLTGALSYTGPTTLNAGSVVLSGAAATGTLGTSALTVNPTTSLAFSPAAASNLTMASGSTFTFAGGTVNFDLGAGGTNDAIVADTLALTANSSAAFTPIGAIVNGSSYTLATFNTLSNSGSFTLSGQSFGALTLNPVINANTITLTATLNESAWNNTAGANWSVGPWTSYTPTNPGDAARFGTAPGLTANDVVTVNSPRSVGYLTFDNAGASYTIGNNASSNLTLDNLSLAAQVAVLSGSHTLAENTNLASNAVVSVASSSSLSITGALSGTGKSVTKTGSGALVFAASSTFSGGLYVREGDVVLTNGTELLLPGSTVELGNTTTTGRLVLGDASSSTSQTLSAVNAFGQGGSVVGGNALFNSILTLDVATTGTVAVTLGGPGTNENMLTFVKTGVGTLSLIGTDTYTGGTLIKNGALQLVVFNDRLPVAGTVTLGDVGTTGKLIVGNGSAPISQTVGGLAVTGMGGSVVGSAATNSTLTVNVATGVDTFAGTLGGPGTNENKLAVVKAGAGTLELSAVNTYTGGTTITGGTLLLSGVGTLGATTNTLGINSNGVLDLGGLTRSVGIVSATGANFGTAGMVGTIQNGTLNIQANPFYVKSGTITADITSTAGSAGRMWIGGDSLATVQLGGVNTVQYSDNHSIIMGHATTGAAGTVQLLTPTAIGPVSQEAQMFAGTLDLNGQAGVTVGAIRLMSGPNSSLVNANTGTPATFANSVLLENAGQAKLGGAGDLTLSGPVAPGTAAGGGIEKVGAGILAITGTPTYTGNTTVTAGTLQTTTLTNGAATTVAADAQLVADRIAQSSLTLQGTALNSTGLTTVRTSGTNAVGLNANTSHVGALSIAGGSGVYYATLDLKNNDLIVDNATPASDNLPTSQLATITDMVKGGSNGGLWTGNGIRSSYIATQGPNLDVGSALGILRNVADPTKAFDPNSLNPTYNPAMYGTGGTLPDFNGIALPGNETLVKYTYYGDANLDGVVTSMDFALLDAGFSGTKQYDSNSGWFFGDFNYDGNVDSQDYALLNLGYIAYSGTSGNPSIPAGTQLPEPSTLVLSVLGVCGLFATYRRRQQPIQSRHRRCGC